MARPLERNMPPFDLLFGGKHAVLNQLRTNSTGLYQCRPPSASHVAADVEQSRPNLIPDNAFTLSISVLFGSVSLYSMIPESPASV